MKMNMCQQKFYLSIDTEMLIKFIHCFEKFIVQIIDFIEKIDQTFVLIGNVLDSLEKFGMFD